MRIMEKSQESFLTLYEPIHEPFVRFCTARAYGVLEAEDLVSDSVLMALENFHKLKDEKAFLSFMFSIASNIANKKHRRQKFTGIFNEKKAELIPEQGIDAGSRLDVEVLYQILNKLPVAQKEALILFEISGFSIKEITEIQKSSESAVKQRLKRGREKLAQLFKSDRLKYETVSARSSVLMSVFL